MPEFKGKKYKLAGFDIRQTGILVDVFAKFCGLDQDPANLPKTMTCRFFPDSNPYEKPCIYPKLSAQQITDAILGPREIVTLGPQLRFADAPEDILADLGPETLALLLVEMRKAKDAYLQSKEGVVTYVPFSPG